MIDPGTEHGMDVLHAKSSADANQILAIVPFQAFNMNLQDDSMVQHPENAGTPLLSHERR